MYDIYFSNTALRQLRKLEKNVQKRVITALERIRIRPYPFVKHLVGEPYFKLRVGDYRLILDIQKGRMVILVLYAGHRKSVYKKLQTSFAR